MNEEELTDYQKFLSYKIIDTKLLDLAISKGFYGNINSSTNDLCKWIKYKGINISITCRPWQHHGYTIESNIRNSSKIDIYKSGYSSEAAAIYKSIEHCLNILPFESSSIYNERKYFRYIKINIIKKKIVNIIKQIPIILLIILISSVILAGIFYGIIRPIHNENKEKAKKELLVGKKVKIINDTLLIVGITNWKEDLILSNGNIIRLEVAENNLIK